jgi:DNA-directed RNA polymerase sigma subunit (sigma70/sigma32)
MSAGMDFNDVIQECYLSAYQAVKQYKGRNGASFITFLKFPLRSVPGNFLGKRYKVIGNPDSLNTAVSLDDLFFGDENDTTYLDMLADPMSDSPYEDVLHSMYVESISTALESALSRLPDNQSAIIRSRYLDKKAIETRIADYKYGAGVFDYTKPWEDVISEVGISLDWAYKLHKDAIYNLR